MISNIKCFFVLAISILFYGPIAANSYTYLPDQIIQEEISVGSLIVDIAEQIRIYQGSAITNENQQYTFLDDHKSSTENTYFLLDTVTGRVTSKRYLDRESMCINKHCMNTCEYAPSKAYIFNGQSNLVVNKTKLQASGDCDMNLKILVIPSYNIVSLNIIIQDINDNKPQFRIDSMTESIPENVPIGYRIPIDFAYDPDIGQNSIQYYSLLESDLIRSSFELTNGEKQLYLIVKQKLDRETVSQFNLTISACDGGVPSNCGTLKIILNVMDINDHNPIFLKDIYTFTVQENLAINSLIGQLSAFDSDEGMNGQISYSIVGVNSNNAQNTNLFEHFEINPSTGLLTLKTALDYEEKQFYSFSVEAKDGGVGSLPAYTTVEISILDVNDNSPEISVSFLNSLHRNLSDNSSIQNIYMNENYKPNKFIAHVSISDKDLGSEIQWQVLMNNQVIQSSTKNSDDMAHNQIIAVNKLNSNSFTINTGSKSSTLLDREKTPTITVSIVSWDVVEFSKASNKAVYTFVIHLTDLNDNKPMFERDIYELSINENNKIGQFIHQFKAIDNDLNPKITYKIEHISNDTTKTDFVSIEETTGILRASKNFDREIKSKYEFYVIAIDNDILKTSLTKVKCTLNILDLNDNAPVIVYKNEKGFKEKGNKTHLVLKVDENIPLLTKLVQISCYDVDQKENGKIKLTIKKNSQLSHTFAKENTLPFKLSTEGEFYVSTRLDREAVSTYNISLMCNDQGIERNHNKTLNLFIKVNDVNDNCPRSVDVSPRSNDKSKFMNKDILTNESSFNIFDMEYTDDDLYQNGALRFELMNYQNLFQLNSIKNENNQFNLQIRFNSNLSNFDQLKLGRYLISLKISDNGFPACIKTDSFRLYIGSNDLNTVESLTKHLSEVFKNPESAIVHYNNDKDDLMISKANIARNRFSLKIPHRDRAASNDKNFMNIFTKDDYIILMSLIGLLVLASMFLSIVGCVYFYKNSSDSRRLKGISTRRADLKVKNYREMDGIDSSINTSTSNSQEDDENSQTEINQLLQNDGILNRFSMNLKNSNPDQSQSADSVLSTSTYARDMTSSSASHNSDDCHRSKSIIYDNQRPSHSTFFGTNNSKNFQPSSFRQGGFSPSESSCSKLRVKIDQKSDTTGSILSTFPNNYTKSHNNNYPTAHQKIYMSKKEMLDNLNPNSSTSILRSNRNESSSDTSEIILPSTVSTTSSPITSSSISSSECEIFEKRHTINQTVENTSFNNQSSLNRTNRGYLRSSAV